MKGSRALLETLKEYDVKHVFGLPGETSIAWYLEWLSFPEINHVLTRDERSACFMADGYAKVSFKPGICEAPSVGATHVIPGVVEAYKSYTPIIILTTDTPLNLERRNMLTGFEQTPLFESITKESLIIHKASDIPFLIGRAFRLATTGRPGPVHVRIPMNVLEEEVIDIRITSQREFSKYPSCRFLPEHKHIERALELLLESEKPVIICGQGVLYSQAWREVEELAEFLGIPVGTTISGKGSFSERHPLSIGVIGNRGGTPLSNKVVEESDLIFFVGCNTDYVATDGWTLPPLYTDKKMIHLDISDKEISNNYVTDVILLGDAKATLRAMIDILKEKRKLPIDYMSTPRITTLVRELKDYEERIKGEAKESICERCLNPLEVIEALNDSLEGDYVIAVDPGTSAIYSSAFLKGKEAGRRFLFNFSLGALGYAIPAGIGAYYAKPESTVLVLTGDGSLGFTLGELETIVRNEINIKIILFRNDSFGWIRATMRLNFGSLPFSTDFKNIDYYKVAEAFGIESHKIEKTNELRLILKKCLKNRSPCFIEVRVPTEDKLIPPVPSWVRKAKDMGLKYVV